MNCYRTPSTRATAQVIQRRVDVNVDGVKRVLHIVKGGNGEWMLSLHTAQGWIESWGQARKVGRAWTVSVYSTDVDYAAQSLSSGLASALRESEV